MTFSGWLNRMLTLVDDLWDDVAGSKTACVLKRGNDFVRVTWAVLSVIVYAIGEALLG